MIDSTELIGIEREATSTAEATILLSRHGIGTYIAAVQVTELAIGMHLADASARARMRADFLELVLRACTVVPFDVAEARETGRLYAFLRRQGMAIGERDLQIAATALVHGHEVLTRNVRDFARIPGLKVIDAARVSGS